MKLFIKNIKAYLRLEYYKYLNKGIIAGYNVHIDKKTSIIVGNNKLIIGNNVKIRSNPIGYQASMAFPASFLIDIKGAEIKIGSNTRINGAYIYAQKKILIGENCVIAAGVNIIDSNGHKVNSSNRTKGRDEPAEIEIGNNVWIGINAIILKGTKIGDNSVIPAGSIVKGIFESDSIISGNPGKIIGKVNINEDSNS